MTDRSKAELLRMQQAHMESGPDYSVAVSQLRLNQPDALIKRLRAKMPISDGDFKLLADWFADNHRKVGRPTDDFLWRAAHLANTLIRNARASGLKSDNRDALIQTACRETEAKYQCDPLDWGRVADRMRRATKEWPSRYHG